MTDPQLFDDTPEPATGSEGPIAGTLTPSDGPGGPQNAAERPLVGPPALQTGEDGLIRLIGPDGGRAAPLAIAARCPGGWGYAIDGAGVDVRCDGSRIYDLPESAAAAGLDQLEGGPQLRMANDVDRPLPVRSTR